MKPAKIKDLYKDLGKDCLDLSKLVFGGVILAGLMQMEFDRFFVLMIGGCMVALLGYGGFVCIYLSKRETRDKEGKEDV